jgi:hypothetical protein
MDPTACFLRFLNAQCEDDTVEAYHAINDLSNWLLKGGFPAKFPASETQVPAAFVHNSVVTFKAACDFFRHRR